MSDLVEKVAAEMCDEVLWQEDHETLKLRDVFESAFGDDGLDRAMEIIVPKLARAATAVCAEEMAKEVEAMRWYVETTPGHIRAKEPADYAAAIRSMGERGE